MVRDAKKQIRKNINQLRYLIKTKDTKVYHSLFTAFVRSLIIYHFTPLLAAGIIDVSDIEHFEMFLLRKMLGLPNDVKSAVIKSVNDHYLRETKEVILDLSQKILRKIESQLKIDELLSKKYDI